MSSKISDKFSNNLKLLLSRAADLTPTGKPTKPKHIFRALIVGNNSLGREILNINKKSEKIGKLSSATKTYPKNSNAINASEELINLLEKTSIIAFEYQHKYIGTEHLLMSMVLSSDQTIKKLFDDFYINREIALKKLKVVLKSITKFSDITGYFQKIPTKKTTAATPKNRLPQTLVSFGLSLTGEADELNIDPVIGREKEIDRIIQILARRYKNNPLLLGDPGVGKTAIVEGLADRINQGSVPDFLLNKQIFNLDLGLLIAGTMFRGEFENRLKQILSEIKNNPNIIIFIDEIHHLMGAGAAQGSLDAAGILKPALARGEIRCIGATTKEEYQKHLESDAALDRRFQIINIYEPSIKKTKEILRGLKQNYEDYHQVTISEDAIEAAVNLSDRYITNRFLPDKAIDLLDEASSITKIKKVNHKQNIAIKQMERRLNALAKQKTEKILKQDFPAAMNLKDSEKNLRKEILLANKSKKSPKQRRQITAKDILKIVEDITNLPLIKQKNNHRRLLTLESRLSKKIIGQAEALNKVADTINSAHLGMRPNNRPLASFIFAGPSGVGKTELAKQLARHIFNDKNALCRIDMSEFKESFNISKLIGAPAGYVGYKESGKLTEAVKRRPYCLILLDEIEKAHNDIFNLLLQILEEGELTDAAGKTVNFRNTIIVMTSNIGSDKFYKLGQIGFSGEKENSPERNSILEEFKNFFRPEFINRIDDILIFNNLNKKHLRKIADLELRELSARLAENDIMVDFSPAVKNFLAEYNNNPPEGARAIRRNINLLLENPLTKILMQKTGKNDKIKVSVIDKQINFSYG